MTFPPPRRFQSTLPARGATFLLVGAYAELEYFNPRSPHGERRRVCAGAHARGSDFNPRSPHGERRLTALSRPVQPYFNPRSPHGERPLRRASSARSRSFQSTLPARGATKRFCYGHVTIQFQSTLPARGATTAPRKPSRTTCISIHAPRTGSDSRSSGRAWTAGNFNPRSPHGERPLQVTILSTTDGFQSTLPARGATAEYLSVIAHRSISIHAPRTGSDVPLSARTPGARGFQSTLPARGATLSCTALRHISFISIHAPRTGSDTAFLLVLHAHITQISIHAPRTGSDAVFVA